MNDLSFVQDNKHMLNMSPVYLQVGLPIPTPIPRIESAGVVSNLPTFLVFLFKGVLN